MKGTILAQEQCPIKLQNNSKNKSYKKLLGVFYKSVNKFKRVRGGDPQGGDWERWEVVV